VTVEAVEEGEHFFDSVIHGGEVEVGWRGGHDNSTEFGSVTVVEEKGIPVVANQGAELIEDRSSESVIGRDFDFCAVGCGADPLAELGPQFVGSLDSERDAEGPCRRHTVFDERAKPLDDGCGFTGASTRCDPNVVTRIVNDC
jgi:hypothetical protein